MDSWMKEANIRKHRAFPARGQNGRAHSLEKGGFNTYCFQLSGSKYMLHMLLQLPILAQLMYQLDDLEPTVVEVPALTQCITDLQEHKKTKEYRDAVARSEKRSSDHRRLSQQIWHQSQQLSKARALFRKAEIGLWDDLIQEEQDLVEAYDGGRLERELQHLVSQKTPVYRGVAASVSDLQKGQRWCQR